MPGNTRRATTDHKTNKWRPTMHPLVATSQHRMQALSGADTATVQEPPRRKKQLQIPPACTPRAPCLDVLDATSASTRHRMRQPAHRSSRSSVSTKNSILLSSNTDAIRQLPSKIHADAGSSQDNHAASASSARRYQEQGSHATWGAPCRSSSGCTAFEHPTAAHIHHMTP